MTTDRLGEPTHLGTTDPADPIMRRFGTGATRHTDEGKLDYEGFLSPHVLRRYAQYLNEHRTQADGKLRDSDNWQQGIPLDVYMKSQLRHTFAQWRLHRAKVDHGKDLEDALCAVVFNVMGYLFEVLKKKEKGWVVMEDHIPLPPVPEGTPHQGS